MKLRLQLQMLLIQIIFEWEISMNQKKRGESFLLGIFADS